MHETFPATTLVENREAEYAPIIDVAMVPGAMAVDAMLDKPTERDPSQPAEVVAGPELSPTMSYELGLREPHPVNDSFGGNVFTERQFPGTYALATMKSPQMQELMTKAGFLYEHDEDGKLTGVLFPDPERSQAALQQNGIAIEHTTANKMGGGIPPEEYSDMVARGNHPVSTANLDFYEHDITSDHMPAVIVCGGAIRQIINERGLTGVSLAHAYDFATSLTTEAMIKLFAGETDEFNRILRKPAASSIVGTIQFTPETAEIGDKLHEAVLAGLDRLGISYDSVPIQ